jgi:gliding motility-associated-like protein
MEFTKFIFATLCLMQFIGLQVNAQLLDYNYIFQSTDTWTELSGDQVVFSGAFDDDVSAGIPTLPITMGVEPHSSLFISTNGFMTLSTAPSATNYDPLSQGISAPVIAPFATNLEGIDATSKVSYTIDFQGIRVQWKNVRRVGYVGESLSFQARIINTAYTGFGFGSISFIYGPFQGVAVPSTSVHVGIRVGTGDTAGTFATRSVDPGAAWLPDTFGTSSTSTCAFPSTNTPEGFPAEGMKQEWFLFPSYQGVTNPDVSPLCNGDGSVVIFSNYDGGTLNINVDQDIPNLKIGICTYEPVEVTISGPFVGNVAEVLYAGFNSSANNNHCGLGNITTTISGVDPSITQILTAPPLNYETKHGNGQSGWGGFGGGSGLMVGVSGQCDTLYPAGGGNTPDEVVYYFLNAFDDDLLFHHTQYDCWLTEVYNISDGGNCCINPLVPNEPDPIWSITISDDTAACFQDEVALQLLSNLNGVGPFTFQWTYNGNIVGETASVIHTPDTSGVACLDITDAIGNTLSQCFNVEVDAPLQVSFSASDSTVCGPAVITLNNETDPSTFSNQIWTVGENTFTNTSQVSFTPELPGVFDVSLAVFTSIGCEYDSSAAGFIQVYPSPNAEFTANPIQAKADDTEIHFSDLSTGNVVDWNWFFELPEGNAISNEQNPTYIFPQGIGGSYEVSLLVTNENGCTDLTSGTVFVDELFQFYVPNCFTPNGDGVNDVLLTYGSDIDASNFSFEVFNRWGELIHYSTDPLNAWQGNTFNGEYYVPNGQYNYRATMWSLTGGEKYSFEGYILLTR